MKTRLLLPIALAACGWGYEAAAQEQPAAQAPQAADDALQEVVVTAQKREENAQRVGIAMVALTGNDLKTMGVETIQDLPGQVPSIQIETPGTPANTTISIRGVGQRDIGPNAEGAVAVYRDGAYSAFGTSSAMPMFDVDRIEVLEGPQGTLFGRNATGGLMQIISSKPTDKVEGYATISGGDHGHYGVEAAVGGPLASGVMGRISLYDSSTGGWLENSLGLNGNSVRDQAGRVQLLLEPSDTLSLHLIGYFNTTKGFGAGGRQSPLVIDPTTGEEAVPSSAAQYSAYCNAAFSNGGLATLMGYSLAPAGSWQRGNCFSATPASPFQGDYSSSPYRNQNYGFTATLTNRWEGATLTSVSDYQGVQAHYSSDSDGVPQPVFVYSDYANGAQFSEEVRLDGNAGNSTWVAGLYYLNIWVAGDTDTDFTNLPTLLANFTTSFDQSTETYAAFAQSDIAFTNEWHLVAGARLTHDSKDIDLDHTCAGNSTFGLVPTGPTSFVPICDFYAAAVFPGTLQFSGPTYLDYSKTDWSGKLQVEYRPTDALLAYLGINRGVKAGGFNVTVPQLYGADVAEFKPETLVSTEAGVKSTFADGHIRLNADVFHYNYDDFQSYLIVDGFLRTINVQSRVNGAELTFEAVPVTGLSLHLGTNYLSAASEVPLPTGTGMGRFVNPDSPRWSTNGRIRYTWPFSAGNLAAQVSGTYVGERTTNAVDIPALRLPSYVRGDARTSFTTADRRWELAAEVLNFTDKAILVQRTSIATLTGSSTDLYAPPRTWQASLTYRWY